MLLGARTVTKYFLLIWGAIMAIQGTRAIVDVFVTPGVGWKLMWVGVALFYGVMAYGSYKGFVAVRAKKSN